MLKIETRQTGFSPEKEVMFLSRLEPKKRRVNLEQELKTQLAEDFGLVEFTLRYSFNNKKIIDDNSGEEIVELTSRGGIEEETRAIRVIEEGLSHDTETTWIHFSPKNEDLGYASNCVDFWRMVDDKVVWNRVVVETSCEEMNNLRTFLSGEERELSSRELLGLPVATKMMPSEIFSLIELSSANNSPTFEAIKKSVEKCLGDFDSEFGDILTENNDLIFRLYSACYQAIKNKNIILDGRYIEDYMYSQLSHRKQETSFGCSVSTTVGVFGEKIGYYVALGGSVKYGEIPKGFKCCKHCGCWYSGDKCPFC